MVKLFGVEKIERKYNVEVEVYFSGPDTIVEIEADSLQKNVDNICKLLKDAASLVSESKIRVKLVFSSDETLRLWISKTTRND